MGRLHWIPNADVFVSPSGELVVMVELAGLTREDLELSIDGGRLRISGQRKNGKHEAVKSYLVMAIANGPFDVVFDIPSHYDLSQARAAYQNGFLRIKMPPKVAG